MRLLLAIALLALWSPPADACSRPYTTVFENFERSAVVAHARVHHEGGKVVLDVIRAIKGSPGNRIRLKLKTSGARSTCTPPLKMRSTGIVFLTAEGNFAAAYDSFPRASKDLLAAMTTYAGASDATARAAVLVDLIAAQSKETRIAFDAGLALADDPAALAAVTAKDRDRLRLHVGGEDSYVRLALVRLGVVDLDLPKYSGELALAKHRTFESIAKPDELAAVIEKENGASPKAAAAFERCERVHGKRLIDVRHIVAGAVEDIVVWTALAKACRDGRPLGD